jgi:iron(III) transport system ATP-binding protein
MSAAGRDAGGLQARGLCKRFGKAQVLDAVDLDVQAGELVCLLGPSGCGKTTLLRIICGIEHADAGRLELDGDDLLPLSAAQRRFGVVFQSYALFPNMSAEDNVRYGLETLRMPPSQSRERAREMLRLVGLSDHGGKFPAQLSGGQQQRVALARALAPKPRLLLLDEPLSALDAQVRASLRHEIRKLQQRLGITTIMVTHDQDEALSMSDRVALMNGGRIEQIGAPAALYRAPATRFVAQFIGRMNLWQAVVEHPQRVRVGQLRLPCRSTQLPVGTTVSVGVRPENVGVFTGSAGYAALDRLNGHVEEDALVTAQVRETTFMGNTVLTQLHSHDLDATLEVSIDSSLFASRPLVQGSLVRVRLPALQVLGA